MKVLVITSFFSPHSGGVESYVSHLAKETYKRGIETDLLTCNTNNALSEENLEFGKVYRLDSWVVLGGTYPIPKLSKRNLKVLRLLKNGGYQLYHTHTRFYLLTFVMSAMAKLWKIPQVHTEHGSSTPKLVNPVYMVVARIYDNLFGRCVFHWSRQVTAVSHAAQQFAKTLGAKNVSITPVGVLQVQDKLVATRVNLGYSKDQLLVVFAGRLVEAKGVQNLIAALTSIADPRVVLCIIGDGPYRKTLEQQYHSGFSIDFKGQLEHDKVLQYIAVADIVVNPSYSEGMPTTILEAAVLGRAILASDVGGTREILRTDNEGRLYPPTDHRLLRKYLQLLIQDEHLRKILGEGAKRHALSLPSWPDIAADFSSIYAETFNK